MFQLIFAWKTCISIRVFQPKALHDPFIYNTQQFLISTIMELPNTCFTFLHPNKRSLTILHSCKFYPFGYPMITIGETMWKIVFFLTNVQRTALEILKVPVTGCDPSVENHWFYVNYGVLTTKKPVFHCFWEFVTQ